GCCPDRLSNYRVSLHDDASGAIGTELWAATVHADGSNSGVGGVDVLLPSLDPLGSFEGQWIQIQNLDDGTPRYLQLAEVRAFGSAGSSGYGALLRTDVAALFKNVNPSAYLRLPFTVTNVSMLNQLALRMRFDDGFVASLNGTEVARGNAPAPAD